MSTETSRLAAGVRRPLSWLERTAAVFGFHLLVFRRTWRGGIIGRLLLPVLVLSSMGLGVGGLVDRSSGGVAGVPYLRYVVPGLVMSSAMQWAVSESTFPVMTYIRWNQMYAVMLTAPNRVADLIRGHWMMIGVGIAWSSAAFIAIAAAFGGVRSWCALLGVPLALLTAMAFVAPLFAFAARVDSDEGFTAIFRLVVTPLMLFSGTFFPITQLPGWLQPVAWLTPLWHGTELARAAFLGSPLSGRWGLHLAVLTAYVVLGYLLTLRMFRRRLVA